MTHRRNQRPLHGCSTPNSENRHWNFNFPQVRLVHERNLSNIRQGSSSMIVVGLQKSMKRCCAKQHRDAITEIGIEKLVKRPFGRMKSMSAIWRNGKHKSKVDASQTIQLFHLDHLQKRHRLRVFFQMFTKLSGRMMLLGLQGHNQSSRKLLRQQEDRGQNLSIQRVNKDWYSPSAASTVTQASGYMGSPASRYVPSIDSYSHDFRPSTSALPKPMPMGTSQATHKHPLPQPAQQGPPHKQVRHKAFPHDQQPSTTVSMASPSAVDMPRQGHPSPKGPPTSYMPTPGDVEYMPSSSPAVDQEEMSGRGRYRRVRSSTDNWNHPLDEQLEPNLTGGPDPSKSFEDLCLLCRQIPRLESRHFDEIYPSDNVIRVMQKSHGVHEVKMREVAAWVLNATHWFSLLKQPMMIVIWCRDWSDASKFQYLMQMLQVQFQD